MAAMSDASPFDDDPSDDAEDGGWEFDPADFTPSPLDPAASHRQFRRLLGRIRIARPVRRSLFTFGDTDLPYLLITPTEDGPAELARGEVTVTRPTILTPSSRPEFFGLFEDLAAEAGRDLADFAMFALQRTAAFDRLRVSNELGLPERPGGGVEEVLARVNRRLDDEEDEDTAVLVAPRRLGPLVVLKYATERIARSGPDNVQELRERGFLPE